MLFLFYGANCKNYKLRTLTKPSCHRKREPAERGINNGKVDLSTKTADFHLARAIIGFSILTIPYIF